MDCLNSMPTIDSIKQQSENESLKLPPFALNLDLYLHTYIAKPHLQTAFVWLPQSHAFFSGY